MSALPLDEGGLELDKGFFVWPHPMELSRALFMWMMWLSEPQGRLPPRAMRVLGDLV
jgi:hypothetical protein